MLVANTFSEGPSLNPIDEEGAFSSSLFCQPGWLRMGLQCPSSLKTLARVEETRIGTLPRRGAKRSPKVDELSLPLPSPSS